MKSIGISESTLTGSQSPAAVSPFFHVVLVEPEIPQNTGNIGRTCVATNCDLHLVGKLGFKITDTNLKRAGLDYWQHLSWTHHKQFTDWQKQLEDPKRVFYFSAKARRHYSSETFKKGDWFVFGKETKGLDKELLRRNVDRTLWIPLYGPVRGLNVATSGAVVVYEAIRQLEARGEIDSSLLAVRELEV